MSGKIIPISNPHHLISQWKRGDQVAARALYEEHRVKAFRLAYSILQHQNDAEDAAQDALSHALLHPHLYDARRASFSTWLHRIVVNQCRQSLRKKKTRWFSFLPWVSGQEDTRTSPLPSPEDHVMDREETQQLWTGIQNLSMPLREALVLRVWGEHSYREIADILECPPRTAQSRVRLAMEALREGLPAQLRASKEVHQ